MNNKGQAVLSEYVMIFFVVIAAGAAITTFLQRAFEARVHDARNLAVDAVMNSGACDANCLQAAGAIDNKIPYEYEPYYTQTIADVTRNEAANAGLTPGKGQGSDVYAKSMNEKTATISNSTQIPPQCANGGC